MSNVSVTASVDRTGKSGSPWLIMLLAAFLVGAAVGFSLLPPEDATKLMLGLVTALAVVGLCGLFAYAVGVLRVASHGAKDDVTKLIGDTSTDGLLVTEGDTRIIYANAAYMAYSGAREPADLRTVERLFSGTPDVSEAVYRLAQAAREGKRGAEELRFSPSLNGDGTVGWYRIRVRPLERAGAKRAKRATLWTVSDVTRERERHENVFQELRHAIDFLDHAPAGFFSVKPEGDIDYMNATLAGWLDYDLTQVGSGGLRLAEIVADGAAAMVASVSGRPGEVKTERFDIDLRQRGGKSLPVRLLHSVAIAEDGAVGASRTLVLNREQGKDGKNDLRAAEVRFARFFNTTPMAIASVDSSGAILRSNAAFARLFPDALKGAPESGKRSIFAAVADNARGALETALAAAFERRTDIAPIDCALGGAPDRAGRFFVSAADEEAAVGGSATIFALDTTEQRTLQEHFVQSQKMQAIGQLAGGIAHDFNNVLTAILGFSDFLLQKHRPTDPSFQDIMQIKQNANRAAGLVRQLLAFSRRQTLRPQVLQMGDVLSDIQMLLRRVIGEKMRLELKHGRDLWLVKADVNQLEQVIVNLVVNARDAMPGGGRIAVRTRNVPEAECAQFNQEPLAAADYVAIEVEDTGHGIPPDIIGKIFEPFFTTKEVGKGTGLGLSTVYGIIKQTGGYIFADSQVGQGTTFRILLPRHIPTAAEEEVKKEVAKPPAADLTGQGTILLVEDEDPVRAFGARALASRGYTVLEAASGVEALEVVEKAPNGIDLVVSDVVMPEMDGPTLLVELRKRGIKAKIVFVSGYAEDAFAKNLPEGEVDFAFLPKPFSLKQLIEAVKTNMRSRSEPFSSGEKGSAPKTARRP